MASTFKKHNPQWKNIKCIMADKDFTERNVFKQQFPGLQILTCIFHCLRSMSREITCEKMKINSEKRAMCLEIIQSIVYAKNAIHYDEIHKKLEGTNIKSVIDYFNKNWHGIRIEWVIYFQSKFMTLGNRTNNQLESINQKITQVVTKFSRLDQLFQGLEMLMVTLRTERDHIATECLSKTPSFVAGLTSEIKQLKQEVQFMSNLFVVLGSKPNLSVHLDTLKSYTKTKSMALIYVKEKLQNGSTKQISNIYLVNYLMQPAPKQQLSGMDIENIFPYYTGLTEENLREYYENPPAEIHLRVWKQAVTNYPNPAVFIPVPTVGFSELCWKYKCHNEQVTVHKLKLNSIADRLLELARKKIRVETKLEQYTDKMDQLTVVYCRQSST